MMEIPFLDLSYQHQAIRMDLLRAMTGVLDGGNFVLNSHVREFESRFSQYNDTAHAVGVGNGLDAITLALKSVGIGAADEVIVPSHTCYATWLGVMLAGARPVPVEVREIDFNMDPACIEAAITPHTKAILPVHLYGHPCKMDEITAIGERHGLAVIEDNAQAHGARYKGRMTGSWGVVNATSFYPTKNLGSLGDAGAVTTNNAALAEGCRELRHYGSSQRDVFPRVGMNSRMDEIQAAALSIKLGMLEQWNEMRRANAAIYLKELTGMGDIVLPPAPSQDELPVYHLFVIRTHHREQLNAYLKKCHIGTAIHYPMPPHRQGACSGLKIAAECLPIANSMADTVLSLPIWPGLKPNEMEYIIQSIGAFYRHHL